MKEFDFFGEMLFEEAKYYLEIAKSEEDGSEHQVASLHEHVAYSELVSHRILDKTGLRQQSTFADGTCVEVDFSKGTYEITVNG